MNLPSAKLSHSLLQRGLDTRECSVDPYVGNGTADEQMILHIRAHSEGRGRAEDFRIILDRGTIMKLLNRLESWEAVYGK